MSRHLNRTIERLYKRMKSAMDDGRLEAAEAYERAILDIHEDWIDEVIDRILEPLYEDVWLAQVRMIREARDGS